MVKSEELTAFVFLGYLLFPLLLFGIWWSVGWFRRKVLKRDGGDSAEGEG